MQQSIKKYKEVFILCAIVALVVIPNLIGGPGLSNLVLASLFLGILAFYMIKRLTTEEAYNGIRNKIRSALDIIMLLLATFVVWDKVILRLVPGYALPFKYDINLVFAVILGLFLISTSIDPNMPKNHRNKAVGWERRFIPAIIGAVILIFVGMILYSIFFI